MWSLRVYCGNVGLRVLPKFGKQPKQDLTLFRFDTSYREY